MILALPVPRPVASAVLVVFVIVFVASLIFRSGCSQLSPRYDPLIARPHQSSALRGTFERSTQEVSQSWTDVKNVVFWGLRAEAFCIIAWLYLPGTHVSSVRPCHNTRNFWRFCKTFLPLPGTSVSSVGYSYQYPELL